MLALFLFIALFHEGNSRCLPKDYSAVQQFTWFSDVVLAGSLTDTSNVTNTVAQILLEESMGYRTSVDFFDGAMDVFVAIAEARAHIGLHIDSFDSDSLSFTFVDLHDFLNVRDAGELGLVGTIAWYIPQSVLDNNEMLDYWKALRDPNLSQYLLDEDGNGIVELYCFKDWAESAIISHLGLNLEAVPYSSDAGTATLSQVQNYAKFIQSMLEDNKPIIYQLWDPEVSSLAFAVNVTKVLLPEYYEDCYETAPAHVDCEYPVSKPRKVYGVYLDSWTEQLAHWVSQFTLTTADTKYILELNALSGLSLYDAACEWVKANEPTWTVWSDIELTDICPISFFETSEPYCEPAINALDWTPEAGVDWSLFLCYEDCAGNCFPQMCDGVDCMTLIGDSVCHDGVLTELDFRCDKYWNDGNDCDETLDDSRNIPACTHPVLRNHFHYQDCDGVCFNDLSCGILLANCLDYFNDSVCDEGGRGLNFNCQQWAYDGSDCLDSVCSLGYSYDLFLEQCVPCPAGHYRGESDSAIECLACEPGTYAASEGSPYCDACQPDQYQNATGATYCEDCPGVDGVPTSEYSILLQPSADSSSLRNGSDSIEKCTCKPGYYNSDRSRGVACNECDEHAYCPGNLFLPYAEEGYWTWPDAVDGIYEYYSCAVGVCKEGDIHNVAKCRTGHTGVICSQCADNYWNSIGTCTECLDSGHTASFTYAVLFFLVMFAWLPVHRWLLLHFRSLYVATNYLQLLSTLGSFSVPWPTATKKIMQAASVINFNLNLTRMECYTDLSFFTKWFVYMVMPFGYLALSGLFYILLLARRQSGKTFLRQLVSPVSDAEVAAARSNAISFSLYFLNMLYLKCVTHALEVLPCRRLKVDGTMYLVAHPEMECWQGDHVYLLLAGALALFVHMGGIPLALMYIGYIGGENRRYTDTTYIKRYGFLYMRFKPELHWWEMTMVVRKLCFTIFRVYLYPYPVFQCVACMAVMCCSLVLHYGLMPFKRLRDNVMETVYLGILVIILEFGVLFSTAENEFYSSNELGMQAVTTSLLVLSLVGMFVTVYFDVQDFRATSKSKVLLACRAVAEASPFRNLGQKFSHIAAHDGDPSHGPATKGSSATSGLSASDDRGVSKVLPMIDVAQDAELSPEGDISITLGTTTPRSSHPATRISPQIAPPSPQLERASVVGSPTLSYASTLEHTVEIGPTETAV
eukprot:Rmarinus@m.17272